VTGWRSAAAALLLLGLAATGAPARADGQGPAPSRVLFTMDDDEVFESSGLVDIGPVVYTTNDSGDDAVLYGFDSGTGKLVSRTTYADKVEDVEALAPGRDGTVWAGDVGDNRQRRDSITAYAVTPRPGRQERPAKAYELVYPDGPHNAETLLAGPRDGRLYVVTKSPFGGTVYVAPRRLSQDSPNRLTTFARVGGLVTDGTFFPGGRRVLLRTYGTATAYTFPGFAPVGTVRLPSQPQGEGISVAQDGRVLVSSEGVRSQVLQVTLPPSFTASSASPTAAPLPPREPAAPSPPSPGRSASDWGWVALAAAGIGSLGYLAVRGSRLRGPRRR
jgi:outer membrane protein assembly factor BamB